MRIYKMTATFGKLEHETLTLEPGLNILEAPNEWGKSTWCAFLMAMLYGLDTRAKTTKTALAEKEKYAPWSGTPMAGRIDLHWNGRDITIERSTKGRTPMGIFRAYETSSGLAVPELTATNCGSVLLGVENSVYRRTGFIRHGDMPVTQDDALRRRLNALVTTGDETGDSDKLADQLKELKNKCRYNRSGLLPQAENQKKELEDKLAELETLENHSRKLKERLGEVKSWIRALENHRDALQYAAAEADARRVAEVRDQRDRAAEQTAALERICAGQPSREEVERKIRTIQTYREDLAEFREEENQTAGQPQPPVPPEQFRGMALEQAWEMVRRDTQIYERLECRKLYRIWRIFAWGALLLGILAVCLKEYAGAAVLVVLGLFLMILGTRKKHSWQEQREALEHKYGSRYPEAWTLLLENYEKEKKVFDQALLEYRVTRGDLDIRRTFLQKQRESLFGSQSPETVLEVWQAMHEKWEAYDASCAALRQLENHLHMLQEMAQTAVRRPAAEDLLQYPAGETEKILAEAYLDQQHLQNRLGQYQGRMEVLGDAEGLRSVLQAVEQRIGKLEDIYAAVTLAQETMSRARQELQRKFAPRIAGQAQKLLSVMTNGRYDRLSLSEDLSLLAGAGGEETLHEVLWRSDGTMDQLYFALRLAVADALIPDAPLVLDDAFVRFDDERLKAALKILKQEGMHRQVIVFTCQSREKGLLQSID